MWGSLGAAGFGVEGSASEVLRTFCAKVEVFLTIVN